MRMEKAALAGSFFVGGRLPESVWAVSDSFFLWRILFRQSCAYQRLSKTLASQKLTEFVSRQPFCLLIRPDPSQPAVEQVGLQAGDNGAFENVFATPKVVAFQRSQAAAGFFVNQGAGGIVPQFLTAM